MLRNESFTDILKSAEQGNAVAQYNIAVSYWHGQGITKNCQEAIKWYRKAAEQGLARAQYVLGGLYKEGKGVARDYEEAVKWFRKAAEQGDVEAESYLGNMYARGEGVVQDYREAFKWYKKAAEQGDEFAQISLGEMYSKGRGVTQDKQEALKWCGKAAEQGNADAQYNMGVMCAEGEGGAEDYQEAIKWFRKAAEQDHADAQFNLGLIYGKGMGVAQDYIEAYKWLILAAAQGDQKAVKFKDTLKLWMAAPQITEAEKLAKEFISQRSINSIEDSPKPEQGDKVQSKPDGIEAWQVALVAAAFALGIDSYDESGRPTKSSPEQQFWPRFSEYIEGGERTKANCDLVDSEQIYLQVFVIEQALGSVQTINVRLASIVMDAWDYYLRTLPQEHGIVFDYQIWCQRRATYAKEWDEAKERVQKNQGFKNLYYHLACCFEDVCHLSMGKEVFLIPISMTAKIRAFTGATNKWIVVRE